jgi:hypothetical protein
MKFGEKVPKNMKNYLEIFYLFSLNFNFNIFIILGFYYLLYFFVNSMSTMCQISNLKIYNIRFFKG